MSTAQTKRLVILGASGHGRVVADIAAQNGYKEIAFLDSDPSIRECGGFPVLGDESSMPADCALFVAIGNATVRRKLMERYADHEFPTLVHPRATVAGGVTIGEGSVVMAGAVINPGARLGKGCIVNTCASVDHDCTVGDFVHVAVGAHLCGTVTVGDETWIGAGATVIQNRYIVGGCMIGAGAAVVKDIDRPGVYMGVPAEKHP